MKLPEIHIHIHIHGETDHGIIQSLRTLADSVVQSSSKLSTAIGSTATAGAPGITQNSEERSMDPLSQAVADLTAAVEAESSIIDSAVTYIQSVPALIDAAVAADVNNGALPQNLTAISGLATKLRAEAAAVQAALTANVPVPGTPDPNPAPPVDPNP